MAQKQLLTEALWFALLMAAGAFSGFFIGAFLRLVYEQSDL